MVRIGPQDFETTTPTNPIAAFCIVPTWRAQHEQRLRRKMPPRHWSLSLSRCGRHPFALITTLLVYWTAWGCRTRSWAGENHLRWRPDGGKRAPPRLTTI